MWQPIETAPTDTAILGFFDGVTDKTWVEWFDDGKPVFIRCNWVSWEPTHWMPLPEPPEV